MKYFDGLLDAFILPSPTPPDMFWLFLGFAAFGLAQKDFRAFSGRANYTQALDSFLLPRELLERQYCDAGYGRCGEKDLSDVRYCD